MIDGTYHTLTCWTDRTAMQAYLVTGAHRQAIGASFAIGSGALAGFEANMPPPWSDVPALLLERGRLA